MRDCMDDFQPGLSAGIRSARSTWERTRPGLYRTASISATVMASGPVETLTISSPAWTKPSASTLK